MIIGITGTLGAGKGTIVEYLECKGYRHFSARDLLTAELDQRGITKNRETMLALANELRETYGPGYIAEQLLAQAKANVQAPWLGFTGFFSVAIMLSLLIFIGEAARDAFDPRKTFR